MPASGSDQQRVGGFDGLSRQPDLLVGARELMLG